MPRHLHTALIRAHCVPRPRSVCMEAKTPLTSEREEQESSQQEQRNSWALPPPAGLIAGGCPATCQRPHLLPRGTRADLILPSEAPTRTYVTAPAGGP